MEWSDVTRLVSGLLDFARVRSTRLTSGHSVLATLRGTEGAASTEEVADCEVWGVAGVQSRPKAPTSVAGVTKSAEVVFVRPGDELIGIASRDLRYQVTVAEGELVIHALGNDGATQAVVRLQANGTVVVEGVTIKLGGAAAAESFVRGTEFLAALGIFASALAADGTNPAVAAAGSALKTYLDGGTAASTVVKGL